MRLTIPASELTRGDRLTDGRVVTSATTLYNGRVGVYTWLDASGGIRRNMGTFAPDDPFEVELPSHFPPARTNQ